MHLLFDEEDCPGDDPSIVTEEEPPKRAKEVDEVGRNLFHNDTPCRFEINNVVRG